MTLATEKVKTKPLTGIFYFTMILDADSPRRVTLLRYSNDNVNFSTCFRAAISECESLTHNKSPFTGLFYYVGNCIAPDKSILPLLLSQHILPIVCFFRQIC